MTCRNAALAARRAGYSAHGAKVTGCRLLTNPNLKAALADAETALSRKTEIDKKRVIQELLTAADVAKDKLDGGNMIRAWCEVAKILGIYAPETVRVVASAENDALRAHYEAMTDAELIAITLGASG